MRIIRNGRVADKGDARVRIAETSDSGLGMWGEWSGSRSLRCGPIMIQMSAAFRSLNPLLLLLALIAPVAVSRLAPAQDAPTGKIALAGDWKRDAFATAVFELNGTESRNNPLRRRLAEPFTGEQLFVRFRLRYAEQSVDLPTEDEGEFVVLWLDESEGNNASTHSGGVPNIGVHVSGNQNRFMVRFASGREAYAAPLIGGRDFLLVARLWKSRPGADQPFDQLNLWVDPTPDSLMRPHASIASPKAVSRVGWIGFSTGGKTEPDDRIFVWDIDLATSWRDILDLPPETPSEEPSLPTLAERTIDFDKHVYPLLAKRCFSCHAGEDAEVRLDVHDEVLNVTTLGRPEASRLWELVSKGEMPPEDEPRLTPDELKTLRLWIAEGVAWNEQRLPRPKPRTDHWSLQPLQRPPVPRLESPRSEWVRTPVDAFIARRQAALAVTPAAEADQHTLTRRMSLDMLGLPPRGSTVSIEELLNDPAYGERWGRHWLDVARWAESNGHQHNRFRPHAWRYRDWVVAAFNSDLPYDQFLTAQLAGDQLPASSSEEESRLIATGFLAAARYSGNELDKRIQRNDILVDIANTTANAFLGLTLECAQCHTHKFDPISIRDYYQFQAFFANGQPANVAFASERERAAKLVEERWRLFDRSYERQVLIRRRRGEPNPGLVLPKTVVARMPPEDRKRFEQLDREIAKLPQTWAFYSPVNSQRVMTPHEMRFPLERDLELLAEHQVRLRPRGDINALGPEVEAAWPLVFGETGDLGPSRRLALAKWMTRPEHPLTARVWVNRIWYWHFGRGLVPTVENLGQQGAKPTHPELLDWLACELIDHDWSTNHIHRLILDSATYRQSTGYSSENASADPENNTYWRWTPRRLEAEAIRDCMLAVSGRLDHARGGPSDAKPESSRRRSLYLRQMRQRLPHQQVLFDSPTSLVSCSRRRVATHSLQPLWLLNSRFSQEAAAALAKESEDSATAFPRVLGRDPTPTELQSLQQHAQRHGLASACQVLLNTSEFLYIP